MTSYDVAIWVDLNRKGSVWRGYSFAQIAGEVHKAALEKLCGVAVDKDDSRKILGVCVAEHAGPRVLHIKHILCHSEKAMFAMLQMLSASYPEYQLTANRNGKEKLYTKPVLDRMHRYFSRTLETKD